MSHVTSITGLSIDAASGVPIHVQIEEQIKLAVARGRLTPGQRLPPVRTLARELGVHVNTVAKAVASLSQQGVLETRRGRGTFVARADSPRLREEQEARLGSIMARALVEAASLGFSPEQMEAGFSLRLARWREEAAPASQIVQARPGPGLVAMGSHDLALDLLASHLRRLASIEMTSAPVGSLGGLIALARGEAHLAGCHLLDEESGEYNVPFAKRVLAGVPAVVVTLVGRVQGLLVPKGNPKGIVGLDDLSREGLRFINRQRGSGTRVLLDYLLRQAGLDILCIAGYDTEVDTHTAVAAAVASGQADAGLGIFAAARAFGLEFLPIQSERYDLAVSRAVWDGPPGDALRRVLAPGPSRGLASREYVDSVRELGGYDTSQTGSVVAELGR